MDSPKKSLLSRVHKDGFSMSVFALFDLFVLALMAAMFSSKFILAPGISIKAGSVINLPALPADKIEKALVDEDICVLNIHGKNMIIFNGKIYDELSFAKEIKNYQAKGQTLLLKADASISGQILLNICAMAEAAGFKQIHIAARPKEEM